MNLFDKQVEILAKEEKKEDGELRDCCKACQEYNYPCPCDDCKQWMNYEEDLNCCLVAIEKNGPMSPREVAKRLKMTVLEVKKVEEIASQKVRRRSIYNDIIERYKNYL